MLSCWQENPNDRPTFTDISAQLMQMLEIANQDYNYVDALNSIETEVEVSGSDEVTI